MHHIAAIMLLAATAPLQATSSQDPPPLVLEDLIAETLQRSPEVQAAFHRWEAARRRSSQEASLPDPTLSIGYSSVGRPYPLAGLGTQPMANAGLMLTQELPAPGKRRLRAAGAELEAKAVLHSVQQLQLEIVSRLKQAYYRLAYVVYAKENLSERAKLLEDLLRVAEARYAAGLAPQDDVLRVQVEITMLEAERARLASQAELLVAEINRLLARPPQATLGHPARLALTRELPPLGELLAAAGNQSPLLAERQSKLASAEIALNLARRDAWPDIALSGGYFTMGAMGSLYMFRVDFKIPVFYGRKQRPAIAEQFERLNAERRQLEEAALSLRYRIQQEHVAASLAARLAGLYATTLVPQAQVALQASLASYQSGASDLISVLSNFEKLLLYDLARLEEIANYNAALSRLEELTGKVLLP